MSTVKWVCIFGVSLSVLMSGCRKRVAATPPPAPTVAEAPTSEPPAIGEFVAEPAAIEPGQSSTLRWSVSNATEVYLEPEIGAVDPSGSREVRPTRTTIYTLSAKGPGGAVSATATVTVAAAEPAPEPPAIAEFVAEPSTIKPGEASTLRWSVSNATEVSLEPEIGAVDPSGSREVRPTSTTTYTLVAKGPGGTVSSTATVTVAAPEP